MRLLVTAAVAALGLGAGPTDCSAPAAAPAPVPSSAPPAPVPAQPGDASQPSPRAVRPLPESAHLLTTDNAQAGEPGVQVFRDRGAWEAAWRQLHAGLDAGPAPAVDFSREMVAVVAAGERTSGGHSIRVDGTSDGGGGALVLHVTATSPGPGCMSTMVMTSPVDVVRVPRAAAVRATTRTVARPC